MEVLVRPSADTAPLRGALLFPAVSSGYARRSNPFDLDLDGFYERYLKTCAMWGITPSSRERVDGLVQEWSEVLAGRREPSSNSAGYLAHPQGLARLLAHSAARRAAPRRAGGL